MTRTSLVLALTALVGCGGGYCEREAKRAEECGLEIDDDGLAECEAMVEDCTSADERKLSNFSDCVHDIAPCGEEIESENPFEMLGCLGELEGISESCAALTFGTGTPTAPSEYTTASR